MPIATPAASWRCSPASMGGSPCSRAAPTDPNPRLQRRAAALPAHARFLVGQREACQLVTAEIDGTMTNLKPARLMSGFYLNELLLKLTERCDPHPEIFLSYAACVQALCDGEIEEAHSAPLREAFAERFGLWARTCQDRRGGCRWSPAATTGSPRRADRSPAWPRRRARSTANPWPICRPSVSTMSARCAMPSGCCARPSMPVSTAAP